MSSEPCVRRMPRLREVMALVRESHKSGSTRAPITAPIVTPSMYRNAAVGKGVARYSWTPVGYLKPGADRARISATRQRWIDEHDTSPCHHRYGVSGSTATARQPQTRYTETCQPGVFQARRVLQGTLLSQIIFLGFLRIRFELVDPIGGSRITSDSCTPQIPISETAHRAWVCNEYETPTPTTLETVPPIPTEGIGLRLDDHTSVSDGQYEMVSAEREILYPRKE